MALGIGGLPKGRITEIYGPESSGKSTLAMHVVAEAQRNGGVCAYVDAEHAMDPVYAGAIGVNVDELYISQLREKIGVVFGNPETTPGGRALKFYSSVRLDIRRIESIKDGTEVLGNRTRVKVVKNKCVAVGTMVFDPASGITRPIETVVREGRGTHVVSADKAGGLHVQPTLQRFDQGEAEVIGLHLRDATALWLTPDHKVLTDRGWREAGELAVGDRVGRPRRWL